MTSSRGAVLVELALAAPLFLLMIAGLFLGLAQIEAVSLERVTGDAARLGEQDARILVEGADGHLVCWWQGSGEGHCFDDGLEMERTQVIARGRSWHHPLGSVTPSSHASRPVETTTTTEGSEP